ncbi:hypothetical protein ABTM70_20105, partial [Acinetobacter baumannii]
MRETQKIAMQLAGAYAAAEPFGPVEAVLPDAERRFQDPAWQTPPYAMLRDSYLALEQLTFLAAQGVHGMAEENKQRIK